MSNIQYFEKNEVGRDFVCGDIHGCFSLLEKQLELAGFDGEIDRLFCVGDLVDRGPESELALFYLKRPWFFSVIGNHEDMIIKGNDDMHRPNGGEWYYQLSSTEQNRYKEAFKKLPLVMKVHNTLIVHADLPEEVKSFNDLLQVIDIQFYQNCLLWSRRTIMVNAERYINDVDKVYLGHTPCYKPKLYGNMHFIDTGSFLYYNEAFDYGDITVMEIKHD